MSHDVLLDGDEVGEVATVRRSGVAAAETTEVFSAALTGFLALGFDLKAAVEEASRFRDEAVARAFAAGEGVMSLDVRSGPPATTAG
jgi:hydroxymethylpyrimidine/phosphomethylpyrimidine kinase